MHRTRTVVERIAFLKNAINMADRVIAPTRLTRDLLIRNGIDPSLVRLSHYGVDTFQRIAWGRRRDPSRWVPSSLVTFGMDFLEER